MQKKIKYSLAILAVGAMSLTGCSEIESLINMESSPEKLQNIEAVSKDVKEVLEAPVEESVKKESKKALAQIDKIDDLDSEGLMSGYNRDKFPHWENVNYLKKNIDGSKEDWSGISVPKSCDVRSAILIDQSITKAEFKESTCSVSSGSWVDTYGNWSSEKGGVTGLGQVITDRSKIDIDHVIPLAGSWRLGADEWTEEKRTRFANDPLNLIASEASANRSKGDQLFDTWAPYSPNAACDYANKYVEISVKYDLGATQSIKDSLDTYLNRCITEEAPNFWEL